MRDVEKLPRRLRGIYVLYKYSRRTRCHDVVYVGMAWAATRVGIKGRLRSHLRSKAKLWTHFSVFEVWENVRDEEITELEGFFRQIYRSDYRANRLNTQRSFKKLKRIPKIL